MEEILNNKVPVSIGFILVVIGVIFYNLLMIRASSKVDKFSDIKIRIWWDKEQIRFVMTLMIIGVIFYMTWYYQQLTAKNCLMLGLAGNLFLDKFMKIVGIGNKTETPSTTSEASEQKP